MLGCICGVRNVLCQVQCDLSVMISPDYYKEFVLPELEASTEWADYVVYHLDGQEQIRHLDYILSVDAIKMIQWTPVAGQPPTTTFIPVLQRIQKAGERTCFNLRALGSGNRNGSAFFKRVADYCQ